LETAVLLKTASVICGIGVCAHSQSFHDAGLNMVSRDLIVIGASAGGLRAIGHIAHLLPATLSACVLVVLHTSPASRGMLASVIGRRSTLPVKQAEHGDALASGQIFVAPPDWHLVVGARGIELDQGPKVNRARPAIDPLFRSAALLYGKRVIGVVLTGFLQDGTAGLAAIKQAGGVAIVQDPLDAEFPSMPGSALAGVQSTIALLWPKFPGCSPVWLRARICGGLPHPITHLAPAYVGPSVRGSIERRWPFCEHRTGRSTIRCRSRRARWKSALNYWR
jgi:chemotaxis response regulator CheB